MKFLNKYILSTLAFLIVILGLSNVAYGNNDFGLNEQEFTVYTYDSLDDLNLSELDFLHVYEILDNEVIRVEFEEISNLEFMMTEKMYVGTSYLAVGGKITDTYADLLLINLTQRRTITDIVANFTLRGHANQTLAGARRTTKALGPNGWAPEYIHNATHIPITHLDYNITFDVLAGAQGLYISDTVKR